MELTHNNVAVGSAPSPFRRPSHPQPAPGVGSLPLGRPQPAPPAAVAAPAATVASVAAGGGERDKATVSPECQQLERQRRNGGHWFYWVAGLSLANSALALAGQRWHFIIGLGITQVADALIAQASSGWMAAAALDLMLIGGFVLLGRCALGGQLWAFTVGIALYALDGVIFLIARDWVGVGFHAFVLMMAVRGFQAGRRLSAPGA